MLILETVAKIRRAYFVQQKTIKAICRELRISRKVVRKVLRSEATELGLPRKWGSGGKGGWRESVVGSVKFLSVLGIERSIIDRAANLKQQVGATPGPSHLLTFVHSAVHQEIGRPFGDRCPNTQARAVAFGVIHQPGALAGQILVQRP